MHSKIAKKFTQNPFFGGSRSFKVIDVDKSQKSVTIACYDKQHVCTYLQLTVFTLHEMIAVKYITTF